MNFSKSVIMLVLACMVTLWVWTFPAMIVLTYVVNWTGSLLVGFLVLLVLLFPLYTWGLAVFLKKVIRVLPSASYTRILSVVFLALLCLALPAVLLNGFYGFTFPTSRNDYHFDTCVLENGASSPDGIHSFECTDGQSRRLHAD